MEVEIILNYREKHFRSNIEKDVTKERLDEVQSILVKAASGQADHMHFSRNENTYFFGKEMLQESIITLKVKK